MPAPGLPAGPGPAASYRLRSRVACHCHHRANRHGIRTAHCGGTVWGVSLGCAGHRPYGGSCPGNRHARHGPVTTRVNRPEVRGRSPLVRASDRPGDKARGGWWRRGAAPRRPILWRVKWTPIGSTQWSRWHQGAARAGVSLPPLPAAFSPSWPRPPRPSGTRNQSGPPSGAMADDPTRARTAPTAAAGNVCPPAQM
jgi:hypothetical protein